MSDFKSLSHIGIASADGMQMAKFFSEYLGGEILSRDEYPEQDQISTMVRIGACELEIISESNTSIDKMETEHKEDAFNYSKEFYWNTKYIL